MAADPVIGGRASIAGRYEPGNLLGRGGMGEVREAWDSRLERRVAVKTLRADVAAQPEARRRFESEARAAARLVHPNVVAVYDSGEDAGIPFMVMELLPGRSLRDEIAAGPLTVGDVESLASQVLGAIGAAHGAGILHRDIKPSNILMTEDGRWKVGDFGIAKSVQMDGGDETATGMVLGTPAYLAPERLFGGEATPSGDLYSLGVILYEALAARRPYQADSPGGWAAVISARSAEPLSEIRRDLPPAMVAAITRSMAPDPGARFSSAAEMADAMGVGEAAGSSRARVAVAGGAAAGAGAAGIAAAAAGWAGVAPAASPTDDRTALLPRAAPAGGGAQVRRRRRAPLAALAGGAALAAIVGISMAAGGGSPSPATTSPSTSTTVTTVAPTTVPTTTTPPPGPHGHGGGGGDGGDGGGKGGG